MLTKPDIAQAEDAASLRRLAEIDWDFSAQASESAFSAVHWHPCRFPSQIPGLAIGRLSKFGDTVLDPFMGSATTLVEAQRLGRRSYGIDINPISCLLGRAKTLSTSASELQTIVNSLHLRLRGSWGNLSEAKLPTMVQADKWYMPTTLSDLRRLHTIVQESDGQAKTLARACFSAILLPSCREDRHWGYVCDNTRPKGERAPDARELFAVTLNRLASAYAERGCQPAENFPDAMIVNGDSAAALGLLPDGLFDCVVTSPPYFGVTDYVKAQRLSMEWEEEAIEPVRQREIGARSKRHRQNALEAYLLELDSVFRQVHRVMKKNASAVIVFGQSPTRPDAQNRFVENLLSVGFSLQLGRRRHISVGRRQMPSVAGETVLVVRK